MKWDTREEIRYLRGLGNHRKPDLQRLFGISRLDLLRNYERTIAYRHKWGDIAKLDVLHAVRKMIDREGASK